MGYPTDKKNQAESLVKPWRTRIPAGLADNPLAHKLVELWQAGLAVEANEIIQTELRRRKTELKN